MNAVAAYMASRNRRGDDGGRRSEYGGAESRMYDGGRSQQPNQYTTRNGMDDWPESNYSRGNDGAGGGGIGRLKRKSFFEKVEKRY